jgi:glycosidase
MPTPRRLLALCLACALTASASAQVLARPGWAGSGINTDLWWKHAVIYQVNPANFSPNEGSPLHGVSQRLDYLHSLGVDAILLTPLQPDPAHAQTIDPALGTLDDLDDLVHEASSRHIRVLLDLNPGIPAADLTNVAHFWLNRGIAGFHVPGTTDAAHLQASALRSAATTYLGQRILVTDADPNPTAVAISAQPQPQHTTRGRHHGHARSQSLNRPLTTLDSESPQLRLDAKIATIPSLTASSIRPAIDDIQTILQSTHSLPLLATDGPAFKRSFTRYADGHHDLAIAKLLATLLFTTRAESLIYYGQELGVPASEESSRLISWNPLPAPVKGKPAPEPTPETSTTPSVALEDADPASLLNWYRQLSALHHGNSTLNAGSAITINRDDQNVLVLVRKPQTVSSLSPVDVILLNLSAHPVTISIKDDIAKLGLRGSFLRTILRSDDGMGTQHLASTTLAPYEAYIGELRY